MSVAILESRDCDIYDVLMRSPEANMKDGDKLFRQYLRRSEEVWLGMYDDKVACVWGLIAPTIISNKAYMWLITTDLVEQHKFIFVRRSQLELEKALKRYDAIIGHVEDTNKSARKWLEWLGAEFAWPDRGFLPFIIRRK